MKKYYVAGVVLILGGIVYFTGLYTYFQKTEVHDPLPVSGSSSPPGTVVDNSIDVGYKTLFQGSFVEVDLVHKGSGTARIIQDGEQRYLRLENFEVTNGPDLYVYLSESQTPGSDLKSLDKYISLGLLKGNIGDQNYEIPKPFQGYNTVVIWCQRFGVLFSYAVMEEA